VWGVGERVVSPPPPTKVHFVDVNSYAPRLNYCLHIGLHKIPNVHLHQLPTG